MFSLYVTDGPPSTSIGRQSSEDVMTLRRVSVAESPVTADSAGQRECSNGSVSLLMARFLWVALQNSMHGPYVDENGWTQPTHISVKSTYYIAAPCTRRYLLIFSINFITPSTNSSIKPVG
jgi:hypothetical protein